ncbi:MAG: endonuclease/exonuclease/phosphatase family protein [Pseudomonadales bacterium]|jgi:endonuclease/exonuclease/phosphatase family metal-dependent hydrolase|nr:endonuclease/exonuclease/phosphatase family protein [Pseudomonadales bacterium]MDP6471452.1 endonuclease/exonuclease/phosphatase family protein [Pseudomonadales bacterium]MDP6828621.1 endonuclease/exonuclease/phosphatase family protein [Pseudomonadales bacterium]MDP6972340.1 endonuclease/exonuclease/phosphatase family protein [Pseudomonadales bacterium]
MLARGWRIAQMESKVPTPPRCASVAPVVNIHSVLRSREQESRPLRFLTFNIQVGIKTSRYRQYVTKGWKHVLPNGSRSNNLKRIADLVAGYDVVALQEVDGGSLRSGFMNQVEYLADRAQFPYWYVQLNRDLGPIAQQGNGLLTRVEPKSLEDHKLPGTIPGRGAIIMRLPYAGFEVLVVLLHLSLGERSRHRQLEYVRQIIEGEERVVVMGDMNSHLERVLFDSPLEDSALRPAIAEQPTWPAWRPQLALDHVLISPGLRIRSSSVVDCQLSDHRPIAVTLGLAS